MQPDPNIELDTGSMLRYGGGELGQGWAGTGAGTQTSGGQTETCQSSPAVGCLASLNSGAESKMNLVWWLLL